ncbi:MAG: nicotinate (nicotinamide) nucleotide adenylyltransferase [Campylobacterales bacterium]
MSAAALFGGSFDPVHQGHLEIIRLAEKILPVDHIIIVPAWQNPFKDKTVAPAHKRLEWLARVLPDSPKIIIDRGEIDANRPIPTIETVERLKPKYDTIYLIIGGDNLASLPTWHRYDELAKLVHFVIATRRGSPLPEGFIILPVDVDISSTAIRNGNFSLVPDAIKDEIKDFYSKDQDDATRADSTYHQTT